MPLRTQDRNGQSLTRYATPKFTDLATKRPLEIDPEVELGEPPETEEIAEGVFAPIAFPPEIPDDPKADPKLKAWLRATGFTALAKDGEFYQHWLQQEGYVKNEIELLAAFCGGFIGPATQRMLGNSAIQFSLSSYFADLAMQAANRGDHVMAKEHAMTMSKLNDFARTNVATAKETGRLDGVAWKHWKESHGGGLKGIMAIVAKGKSATPGLLDTPNPEIKRQMRTMPRANIKELAESDDEPE